MEQSFIRTRIFIRTCGLALSIGLSVLPAFAQENGSKITCIRAYNIDHTAVPDKNTMLFYMKGGKVWKNTLTSPCYTLKFSAGISGFIYSPTNPATDEICANLQTIRVRDTGETCFLGDFSPYDPKAAAAAKAAVSN